MFVVLSFQCNNWYNVINGQRNNKNPLYFNSKLIPSLALIYHVSRYECLFY